MHADDDSLPAAPAGSRHPHAPSPETLDNSLRPDSQELTSQELTSHAFTSHETASPETASPHTASPVFTGGLPSSPVSLTEAGTGVDEVEEVEELVEPQEPIASKSSATPIEPPPQQLAYSTLLSLLVVLVLIVTIRFTVPPLVESLRYSWHHGQLRAEYELSGQRLQSVSLNSLTEASELVSRRMGPSVVHINLLTVMDPFGEGLAEDEERGHSRGQGSGVVLDTDGHILTNQHVLEGASRIEVVLSDGRRVIARVVAVDEKTDLAVIKIEASGLMPAEWGDSDRVDVGSPVWAVGSPFGLERTVTFGILSGKHRIDLRGSRFETRVKSDTTTYSDLMQSDVAVNPGNSGGPLVNSMGQIIGINTAIVGDTYIGISFSIPSNIAKRVASGLIQEGEVARGWLGVLLQDYVIDNGGSQLPIRGAQVLSWANKGISPAKAAGIRIGDVIVKIADDEVTSTKALIGKIALTDVGKSVPIEVLRDGERLVFQVEVGRRPPQN